MAKNSALNKYFQKCQSYFEADHNLGIPGYKRKNTNLEANNNTRSCTGTSKR